MAIQSFMSTRRWTLSGPSMPRMKSYFTEAAAVSMSESIQTNTGVAVVVQEQTLQNGKWVDVEKAKVA